MAKKEEKGSSSKSRQGEAGLNTSEENVFESEGSLKS